MSREHEFHDDISLTPAERELELALHSLQPAPARFDVAAAAEAARRLDSVRRRRRWASAAAVAVAVAWVAWLGTGQWRQPPRGGNGVDDAAMATGGSAVQSATLLAYRSALMRSPSDLEALLDRQTALGRSPDAPPAPVSASVFWDGSVHRFLGDM